VGRACKRWVEPAPVNHGEGEGKGSIPVVRGKVSFQKNKSLAFRSRSRPVHMARTVLCCALVALQGAWLYLAMGAHCMLVMVCMCDAVCLACAWRVM